jgi:peptide/nickel transport system permease protein
MNKEVSKALIKRFLTSLLTLFLLVSLLFVIIRLSPGNPTNKFISAQLGTELAKKVSQDFMLNKSLPEQYFAFFVNMIKGDLGVSYNFRLPVIEVVWEYFSFTLIFALLSFVIQLVTGFYLAIFDLKKQNRNLSGMLSNFSLFIYSVPAFVLGVSLIYLFSVNINLFPISGLKSLDYDSLSPFSKIIDIAHHIVLPLITLSAAGVALFYKYIKESMYDVINQPFILNLKASGFDEKTILKKHIIPNAAKPLISVAGIELGVLLGGTLITEVIFSLPGMGRLAVDSILSRDYPLIIGCVFTSGALMIITNFLADIIKMKIDKRLIKGLLS